MKIIGIICEYNPLHMGHTRQLRLIRDQFPDCAVVCLMSGNYVQRGAPAIFDKSLRAKAAVLSGADLVLELPVQYALSSAEGFAAGGVEILGKFCTHLCFGCESGDAHGLLRTAQMLLDRDFPEKLHRQLDKGLSFPAARQAALGEAGTLLSRPNDILAVEYCKAILSQNSAMEPFPILRLGNYHAEAPDPENPSATAVRNLLRTGKDWQQYVPECARDIFGNAAVHTLNTAEQAILYRLRTMTDQQFQALPYGSEGLWRKFMHACRSQATLEAIITATKSKRYTRSRIDRMVMCAFLGLSEKDMQNSPPYVRVLGFTDAGRRVLKLARETGDFPHTGEPADYPYALLEQRCDDLYGLFSTDSEAPGITRQRRVFYHCP